MGLRLQLEKFILTTVLLPVVNNIYWDYLDVRDVKSVQLAIFRLSPCRYFQYAWIVSNIRKKNLLTRKMRNFAPRQSVVAFNQCCGSGSGSGRILCPQTDPRKSTFLDINYYLKYSFGNII